jgi:hypothetical protein
LRKFGASNHAGLLAAVHSKPIGLLDISTTVQQGGRIQGFIYISKSIFGTQIVLPFQAV